MESIYVFAPDMNRIWFKCSQNLRNDIFILKNGRAIKFLEGLETKLEENDEIAIFFKIFFSEHKKAAHFWAAKPNYEKITSG